MELEGRVVVITGTTGSLGRVVAQALDERGAAQAVLSSDQSRLDALGHEVGLPAERWVAQAADLRDPALAQRFVPHRATTGRGCVIVVSPVSIPSTIRGEESHDYR